MTAYHVVGGEQPAVVHVRLYEGYVAVAAGPKVARLLYQTYCTSTWNNKMASMPIGYAVAGGTWVEDGLVVFQMSAGV